MKLAPIHVVSMTILVLVLSAAPVSLAAEDEGGSAGHVYVLNNNLAGANSITVFARGADGKLTEQSVAPIGGLGSLAAFFDGTEGSLVRTPDGSRLFAVDAGSDQISVVDVHSGQLSLAGIFPSGGAGPVSLTFKDGLLYVLNAANASAAAANVTGFRVDEHGGLHAIPGATRPLSSAHPNPAQVQLSPDGTQLVVTEKSTNLIDLYEVAADGSLNGPASTVATGLYPFGMAFDPTDRHELLVDDGISGAVTAYRLTSGQLQVVDGPVADHQVAPCWMVITSNGHFAYTSNADSQTISGYGIQRDGSIALLNAATGATGTTPADTFPLEESLSRNSQYLYVLDSRLLLPTGPGPATLSGFRIERDGQLTPIVDPATITLPFSAIGQTAD